MSGVLSLQWNNHSLAFLNLLNSLHSKELYCDATIACHGKFYPVHRMVLSTCSEYFQEIFNLTQCKHPFIIINDAQPSQLEALLEYMYKGNISVPQNELPNLLKTAEALRIKGLAVPDNLSTDKELSKKRSSSQTSSSKKLKVSNKEKEDNGSRRESLNHDSRDAPDTNVFEDNRECIIEENPPIKQEPIDPENNDAVIKSKLENERPNNVDENVVKSEPYDPSYADAHQNQLQYPSNTEWVINNGNDQTNQQSICGLQDMLDSFPERIAELPSQEVLLAPSLAAESSVTRFQCPYCPFWSKEHSIRSKHMSVKHSEYLPFGCSICNYKCLSRATLLIHIRKHTGEKPFTCPYVSCSYKSTTKSNLRRHMKIIHSQRPRPSV